MKKYLFFICLLITTTIFSQERRLAIVIGNSAYEHGGILKNPVNDAMAMKEALAQVGFTVLDYYNLSQGEMKKAIDDFGLRLRDYDVGLMFYAGHGIQVKGDNYLIPVDADIQSEIQVEYDCVRADRVLAHMNSARTKINLLILDACRNNPFERNWTRSGSGSGLAFMNAPTGTLIAYATSPGSVAADGVGFHGLYTEAILENILISDISILEMFQNVRNSVNERSNYQQIPWESTSLVGNFYFNQNRTLSVPSEDIEQNIEAAESIDMPEDFSDHILSGEFIDIRDDQNYEWVRMGEQVWMAENLNYQTIEGSVCYEKKQINCDIYGRLYNFEAAQNACPDGWHLPSDYEWEVLKNYLNLNCQGNVLGKGIMYWADLNLELAIDCGFNALPGGVFNLGFAGLHNYASFHSCDTGFGGSSKFIWATKSMTLQRAINSKSNKVSIRCIKDNDM
jgi:uncharacterized protein (TIGR02145 family)